VSGNSTLNITISIFAVMTSAWQAGDGHHIRDQNAHPHPTFEAVESVGRSAHQLDCTFHHADAAFDAIAKIETLLEQVLIFVDSAFWGRSSGL
jgi:hypothetical protein